LQIDLRDYGPFTILTFQQPDLDWLFLIEYTAPVHDPPEVLRHPNTAQGILDVWLREQTFEVAQAVGIVSAADGVQRGLTQEGEVMPIEGVTIRVESIEAAQRVLQAGMPGEWPIRSDALGHSIYIPAHRAHGLAIEFRELR
jgi:hypothetical protein